MSEGVSEVRWDRDTGRQGTGEESRAEGMGKGKGKAKGDRAIDVSPGQPPGETVPF